MTVKLTWLVFVESDKMHWRFKVIWVLQNIIYSSAPIVTIFYWNLYYQGKTADTDGLLYTVN